MHCPSLSNISFPNNTEHAKLKDDTENIKLKNSTKHAKLKTKLWKMSHKSTSCTFIILQLYKHRNR